MKKSIRVLAGLVLLVAVTWGIPADFRHQKYPDKHFEKYASQIEHAKLSHKRVVVPINPEGVFIYIDN